MKVFAVLLLAAIANTSLAIERCALVIALQNSDVIGIKGYTLEDYVCMAHHASNYNHTLNISASEYGIFQINSYWWCNDGCTYGRKNLCGIRCTDLLNTDLSDDIRCLKRIVKDPNGLDAWKTYTKNCKGQDLSFYTQGC
ncbi:lysozyme C-like [Pseudophryne corroboree]|uniref:lysozyme C-like n=1 Tax=Pseudophryne corroboree TaxID=495146 RepID=UPI003081860C